MKRRTFLLGVGGATASGSALLASGAFSRVESQREVTIQVARDPNAYLGLQPLDTPNSNNYVDLDDDGHLAIEVGEHDDFEAEPDGAAPGKGVNSDSHTWFDGMFTICNQGKEAACVSYALPTGVVSNDVDEQTVAFYQIERTDAGEVSTWRVVEEGEQLLLELGECIEMGIRTVTVGIDAKANDTLIDGAVQLTADVDGDCVGEVPPGGLVPGEVSDKAISFIAFCRGDGTQVTVTDIDIVGTNDDGEPVGVRWSTQENVDEVVLKGANEWYKYEYDPATTTGTAWMSEEPDTAAFEQAANSSEPVSFPGDDDERCPSSPCDGGTATKIEYDDGFDTDDPEYPGGSC